MGGSVDPLVRFEFAPALDNDYLNNLDNRFLNKYEKS
jgi:hypothetical protein